MKITQETNGNITIINMSYGQFSDQVQVMLDGPGFCHLTSLPRFLAERLQYEVPLYDLRPIPSTKAETLAWMVSR